MTGWSFNSLKEWLVPWEQDTTKFILLGLSYSGIVKPIAIGISDHFSLVFKRVIVNSGYWHFCQICLLRPRNWPPKSLEQSKENSPGRATDRRSGQHGLSGLISNSAVNRAAFLGIRGNFNLTEYALLNGLGVWNFLCVLSGYLSVCMQKDVSGWLEFWEKSDLAVQSHVQKPISKQGKEYQNSALWSNNLLIPSLALCFSDNFILEWCVTMVSFDLLKLIKKSNKPIYLLVWLFGENMPFCHWYNNNFLHLEKPCQFPHRHNINFLHFLKKQLN